MAAISNDWLDALKGEFKKPYYKQLFETVKKEYAAHPVFPPVGGHFQRVSPDAPEGREGGHPGAGPLSQCRTGSRAVLFRQERRAGASVPL